MTLPGVELVTQDTREEVGGSIQLATLFAIAETTWGPEGPQLVRGPFEQAAKIGERTVDTLAVHDDLSLHFAEGGSQGYVSRLLGPASEYASTSLTDGTTSAGTVKAIYKGARGNRFGVDVDVSGGTFVLTVVFDGEVVAVSPSLANMAAGAAWAANLVTNGQLEVQVTDGPGGNPTATATPQALTAGDDDFDGVTTTQIQAAADRLGRALGPGTLILPGRTALPAQLIAAAHVSAPGMNRLFRAELPSTKVVATLKAQALSLRTSDYADRIDILAPRLPFPGLTNDTTRYASPCVLRTGCEARNDALGISPNQPAAGRWGIAQVAGTPTIEWSDDEREQLNDAGINVVRVVDGDVRVYGSRTAVDPSTRGVALRIGSARLRMAIAELARFEAEREGFGEIDPGGVALGNLRGMIESSVKDYAKSLYYLAVTASLQNGDLPGEYFVLVGVEFQASPDAERVKVVITRDLTEI